MNKLNQKNYILYVRKSTDTEDKQVLSLDSQVESMEKIAEQSGIKIFEMITESRSAKKPYNRPEFAKMMEKLVDGRANGIICWKLDRLARNPIDGGQVSWMLQQGIIQGIKTYDREYLPTDNVLIMAVELGMANQYVRDLSVNVTRGLYKKAQDGWYPSRAPLGYLNDRSQIKGSRTIVKDPERFDLVRRMFDYVLTGAYSSLQIWRTFSKELNLGTLISGKLSKGYIYRIFSNTFYYGDYEYPKKSGNWCKGKHEPMITKDEFDRIQVLLNLKTAPKSKGHFFPFTTLIRCHNCNARITAEYKVKKQKNGNIHRYVYYHCTKRIVANCTQKSVEEAILDKQLFNEIEKITIPPEFHEWALAELKVAYQKDLADRSVVVESLQREYNKQIVFLDSLIEMRINKELTEEEFASKKSLAMQNKLRLQSSLDRTDQKVDDWVAKTTKLLGFTLDAIERFNNGTPEVKREMLAYLGSNHQLFNQKLALDLEKPLLYVEEASRAIKSIHERLEPTNNGLDKERLWSAYSQNPLLYPRRESNPHQDLRRVLLYPLSYGGIFAHL